MDATEKPVLYGLVARPLPGGDINRTKRVALDQVLYYLAAGYAYVGPDPLDEIALAKWEREHGNTPGWWK
jgi:hypothetical protein